MANNTLYSTLKQYILRKLGSPVINIEITDDQLEDCIDEAVLEFIDYHVSGTNIGYIQLQFLEGVDEYVLDDNIQAILDILTPNDIMLDVDDPLLIKRFYVGTSEYDVFTPSLIDVEVFRQSFKMIENQFRVPTLFDFNDVTKKLFLEVKPSADMSVFLKVYKSEENIKPYLKDLWLKKYSVALARRQWADNLMKFTGGNLPGGVQFNSSDISARAERDIEVLKEELEDRFSAPLDAYLA